MESIPKSSYAACEELIDRVSLYLNECQATPGRWGPTYAKTWETPDTVPIDPPTEFAMEWKEWMDTAVWTVAVGGHAINDPLLTQDEINTPHVDVDIFAEMRGGHNGGHWTEYAPPPPPEE